MLEDILMKKWEKFSKEEIEEFVKNSYSFRELGKKCGYNPDGGSTIKTMKEMVNILNLDISHFTGQGWNKNNFDYSRFRYGNNIRRGDAIDALIYLRGHQCECCLNKEWLNQPITLEVHHIDGDNQNNELSNLQLLCPNCHAQTDNWRGRNISKDKKINPISEQEFVQALQSSPNIRQALLKLGLSPKGGNYQRANELIIKYQIIHLL